MLLHIRVLVATLALPLAVHAAAQDSDVQAQREAAFAELLTGAKLVGFFTQSNQPEAEPKEDSYTLTRVSKAEGDEWLFEASIEFGENSIPIGLNLPVVWAGDTPVISVTDMGFPMLGTYSARVLFHDGQYAGVWSGKNYGGQMWGRVVKDNEGDNEGDAEKAGEPEPEDAKAPGKQAVLKKRELDPGVQWPSFRGADATGVADGADLPVKWDVDTGENIRWRVPLVGLAHSSPVIWNDRIFVTTAVRADGDQDLKVGLYGSIMPIEDESEFRFELHCVDKKTGKTLWSQLCWQGVPAVERHPKGSHAASTPTTDGERVLAFFGEEGLYCFDMNGELLWKRDFGALDSGFYMVPDAQWGFGSSPVLYNGLAIVQCDVQEGSFVAALDAKTGEDVWRTPREDVPTWSTPTVLIHEGRGQVICNGFRNPAGYDLQTGEELWSLTGGGDIPVPTPVVAEGLIFLTSAHGQQAPILAIDPNASGELKSDPDEEPFLAWGKQRRGNYMQTPLAYGEQIYFCSDAGIVTCYATASGRELYRERLGSGRTGFTSSPVAANGHLYYASEEGDVHVVSAFEFDVVSVNSLGEECMATPAISEGALYYRTRGHLVAVGF